MRIHEELLNLGERGFIKLFQKNHRMPHLMVALVMAVFILPGLAQCQVTATGGEVPQELVSPMTLEIPADDLLKRQSWYSRDLGNFICDDVTVKMVSIIWKPISKGRVKMTYAVSVKTRPSHDKKVTVLVRIENDDENLPILFDGNKKSGQVIKIDAEEKKMRMNTAVVIADSEDFERVLTGKNPRVVLVMHVREP